MEYLEYGDLMSLIKTGNARPNATAITQQLLKGLEVLHARKICHRDLKPQNVLIASTNPIWVKIADFGISKQAIGTNLHTRVGTLEYLAPEIIGVSDGNRRGEYTNAVDLWALGCILYELLTSLKPFVGEIYMFENGSTGVYSRNSSAFTDQPRLNIGLLQKYCSGNIPFPEGFPQISDASPAAIKLVKNLLVADPDLRLTASEALNSSLFTKAYDERRDGVMVLPNFQATSAIAATAWDDPKGLQIRVYLQDISGSVREFRYDRGWSGGTSKNIKFETRPNSPLGIARVNAFNKIWVRIYSLGHDNALQEHCWEGGSWYAGSLTTDKKIIAEPYSKIGAIQWPSNIRVYFQESNNTITETQYTDGQCMWSKWTLPLNYPALKGTSIATICWGHIFIRVYYQDNEGFLREFMYHGGWKKGSLKAPARLNTPLSVVGLPDVIRLYYLDDNNFLQEQILNKGANWAPGGLGAMGITAAPNSSLSAVVWQKDIRIYYHAVDNMRTIHQWGLDTNRGETWRPYRTLDSNEPSNVT